MEESPYPRPDNTPATYDKDRTWGIVIIVLSALGALCGLMTVLGGAALGAMGAGALGAAGGEGSGEAAAAAGVSGGLIAIIGGAMLLMSVINIAAGVGVMKSLKWGFTLLAILSGLGVILNLFNLPQGIVGILINGLFLWYAWSRLSGRMGPPPL